MSTFFYLPFLIYLLLVVITLWILWAIIRSAVRRALRDHQEWLEGRGMR
ncbi:hypothetical protein [Parafrigoribacterium soli]